MSVNTSADNPERDRDVVEAGEFGARVRKSREQAGTTLEQLARRSGVSRAMLSKVERGEKSPTIGVATRIAHGLETQLSELIGGQEQHRAVAVVRRADRHIFRDPETGFERHIVSPVMAGSAVEMVFHNLPANQSTGMLPPYPRGTEKHVVIVQGELVVTVGRQEIILRMDDALYFEADVEHAFTNRTRADCRYYLVIVRCP